MIDGIWWLDDCQPDGGNKGGRPNRFMKWVSDGVGKMIPLMFLIEMLIYPHSLSKCACFLPMCLSSSCDVGYINKFANFLSWKVHPPSKHTSSTI